MKNILLGPEQSAPIKPLQDPDDLDGLDLDLLPPEPPQSKPAAAASPKLARSPLDAVTFDDDELLDDEPSQPVATARSEPAEVFFSDEEDAVDEDLAPAPTVRDKEPAVDRDDAYWNPLAELDVKDDVSDAPASAGGRGGGRGGRSGGGGRGGDRGRSGGGSRGASRDRGERRSDSRDSSRSRGERSAPASSAENSRSAPRRAPVSEELFADDDFGLGLVEESRAQIAASEVEGEEELLDVRPEAAEAGAESGEPRKRRRRRGRRGRGRDRERTEAVPASSGDDLSADDAETPRRANRSDDVLFGEDEEAAAPPSRSARRDRPESSPRPARTPPPADVEEDVAGDDFGVEIAPRRAASAADDEVRDRGRSRRGGPRRERSRSDEDLDADTPAPVASRASAEVDDDDAADDSDSDESMESRKDKYRNVPSWEQAIAYLVQPKRRASSSGRSGSRGGSRGSRGGGRPSRPRTDD